MDAWKKREVISLRGILDFNGRVVGVWGFTEDAKPLVRLFLFETMEENALRKN